MMCVAGHRWTQDKAAVGNVGAVIRCARCGKLEELAPGTELIEGRIPRTGARAVDTTSQQVGRFNR